MCTAQKKNKRREAAFVFHALYNEQTSASESDADREREARVCECSVSALCPKSNKRREAAFVFHASVKTCTSVSPQTDFSHTLLILERGITFMQCTDIGIDLGTASILVYIRGKGVVLKEPSVVAFDRDSNKIKAIGEDARLMLGRTPGNIVAVRPLRQGVISDYTVTEKMMKYFIQKALGKRIMRKPRIAVCVPSGVTEVEKKAVEDATYQAGAREVSIIEEPIAAAIGAGIDISKPCGNMIVDIGGGTTDIAVVSLGGTVVSASIKIAGDDFDEAIVRYMRKKHNLLIGERTAEDLKIKIGSCYPRTEPDYMDVRGRNLVTGLPKTVKVSSEETEEALRETTSQIIEAIHSVLEKTPPELAADIADRGIVLTGGGSLLRGLEELISSKTGINTITAEDPMTAVAIGTGKYVEFLAGYREE